MSINKAINRILFSYAQLEYLHSLSLCKQMSHQMEPWIDGELARR